MLGKRLELLSMGIELSQVDFEEYLVVDEKDRHVERSLELVKRACEI